MATLGQALAEIAALKRDFAKVSQAIARQAGRMPAEGRASGDSPYLLTAADPSLLNSSVLEGSSATGIVVTGNTVSFEPDPGARTTVGVPALVVLPADVTVSDATPDTYTDVTDLEFAVVAGSLYWFHFFIQFTAATTGTGAAFSLNGPAITSLRYRTSISDRPSGQQIYEGLTAYDEITSTASSAATDSNIAIVEGFLQPSASGTVIARVANGLSSSAITAKAGSFLQWLKVQ